MADFYFHMAASEYKCTRNQCVPDKLTIMVDITLDT